MSGLLFLRPYRHGNRAGSYRGWFCQIRDKRKLSGSGTEANRRAARKEGGRMAYVKHGTGNDYKKGNRKRGKDRTGGNPTGYAGEHRDISGLRKNSSAIAERTELYKKVAENQAKVIKYGQPYALTLLDNLNGYIVEQRKERRPLTIAGLIRASGMSADTYYRYREGKADHLLYIYMDEHGISYDQEDEIVETAEGEKVLLSRLSAIIKSAELAVQEQLEENCYTNRGNPAGSIFGLKARYDWQDTPADTRTTNNNTLVLNNVASLDEAKEALKRLNG